MDEIGDGFPKNWKPDVLKVTSNKTRMFWNSLKGQALP
jgi:hypothetical protein